MEFFTMASALFFVINPIGNTPFIVSILAKFDAKTQMRILTRELILGLILALLFVFIGQQFLDALEISNTTIGICGGVILFVIALELLFPKSSTSDVAMTREPYLVPLATPVLSGPCLLTTVMLYSHQVEEKITLVLAICTAWFFTSVVVLLAPTVQRLFGKRGLIALEQLMGMLLTFLSLDMLVTSLIRFMQQRS